MLFTPIDKAKEASGVEVQYYGITLTVARANNTKFKHLFRTLIAPHKYQMDNNQTIPDEVSEDIMLQCYSQTILVDWKGAKDPEGKEVKYSTAEAYKTLKEDEDVYDFVKNQANNMDLFIVKEEKETKGK